MAEGNIVNFKEEQLKQEDRRKVLQDKKAYIEEEAYDLFHWYQTEDGGGLTAGEAYVKAEEALKGAEDYLKLFEGCKGSGAQVLESISVDLLKEHCNWDNLSHEEKCKTLWKLGVNTKDFPFCTRSVRRYHGKEIVEEWVVQGFERKDKGWLEMRDSNFNRYASVEVLGLGVRL